MKNTPYYIVLSLLLSVVSCNDYLNVIPENEQNSSSYWQSKEEVEAVLGAGYVKLRNAQERIYLWGEARGNGISFNSTTAVLPSAAIKVRALDILLDNELSKWGDLYKVINMANSVIKYAPDVVNKDESFNQNVMNSFLSEAYFLRALSYFYLVRTFGNVPYVSEPYVDDESPYIIATTDGDKILENCMKDLTQSIPAAKEYFPETTLSNPINTKGRATKWAIYALMADINLWLGNYTECVDNCNKIINSGRVGLLAGTSWFTNFYPGNSNESIFEIQYTYNLGQTNSFITWFSTNTYYVASPYEISLYEPTDIRGKNASYKTTNFSLWKYIGKLPDGSTARSSTNENDQNYIVYRIADVYLMQAEAYIMLGTETDLQKGVDNINLIRNRAGVAGISVISDQQTMLTSLLSERQRELLGEGKSWFDILRIGKRDNYKYKELLTTQVLSVTGANAQAIIRSRLADVNSWYLPYHEDETAVNPLLVQNSYYEKLGK